jgi:hypothetical protein
MIILSLTFISISFRVIFDFLQEALNFSTDTNRREPVENGVANLDILITKVYDLISKYRLHEVISTSILCHSLTFVCSLVRIFVFISGKN